MAQDWRERQHRRNEERRRMEEEESRRIRGRGYQEGRDFRRSGMANSKTTMKVDRTAAMSQVVFLERADLVTCRRLIPSSGDRAATTAPRPAIDPESGM